MTTMKLREAKMNGTATTKQYDYLNRLSAIQALNSQQSNINSYNH